MKNDYLKNFDFCMHVDCCFDYLDYVEQYSFDVEYGDCFKQSYPCRI